MRRVHLVSLSIIPFAVFAWLSLGLGAASCNQGVCGVATSAETGESVPLVQCGITCIDPTIDASNCGGCGVACGGDQSCSNGTCCAIGETAINGDCCPAERVSGNQCCPDGQVDADGICCDIGLSNVNGLCCNAGELNCGGACVDPQLDNNFCGASDDCAGGNRGVVCAGDLSCDSGLCGCPAGTLACDDSCIDPNTDVNFCGAGGDCQGDNRGVACRADQSCIDGVCDCLDNQIQCQERGGELFICVDSQTDPLFCGAIGDCLDDNSGRICLDAQLCTEGVCLCPDGEVECNGACIDPNTDPEFCGAVADCLDGNAGTVCGDNQVCNQGVCADV